MLSGGRMSSNLSSDNMKTNKAIINGTPPMSARTFKNSSTMTSKVTPRVAAWSMIPLMEVLPNSPPPPNGSSSSSPLSPLSSKNYSPKSDKNHFFSDLPGNVSSPRLNQEGLDAKDFSKLLLTNFQANPHKGSCLSKLSMPDAPPRINHEIVGSQTNSERDERSVDEEDSHLAQGDQSTNEEDTESESPIAGRDKLMDRPKPYREFLDEVKKQELQAEVEAWKKAEQIKLMTKLRQEEAAIEEWEFKQTSKALDDIKKLELKLEKQRTKAVENTWKKMNMTKEEANNKKIKARQCTIGRLSEVSENSHKPNSSTKTLVWKKLTVHCKTMYFKSVRGKAPLSCERKRSLET